MDPRWCWYLRTRRFLEPRQYTPVYTALLGPCDGNFPFLMDFHWRPIQGSLCFHFHVRGKKSHMVYSGFCYFEFLEIKHTWETISFHISSMRFVPTYIHEIHVLIQLVLFPIWQVCEECPIFSAWNEVYLFQWLV